MWDLLSRFDTILEEAAQKGEDKWVLPCDLPQNNHVSFIFAFLGSGSRLVEIN